MFDGSAARRSCATTGTSGTLDQQYDTFDLLDRLIG